MLIIPLSTQKKEILNLKNFKLPKAQKQAQKSESMRTRKDFEKVDTIVTDASVTTRTIVNDKVFIETEFPPTNANFTKVNIKESTVCRVCVCVCVLLCRK